MFCAAVGSSGAYGALTARAELRARGGDTQNVAFWAPLEGPRRRDAQHRAEPLPLVLGFLRCTAPHLADQVQLHRE